MYSVDTLHRTVDMSSALIVASALLLLATLLYFWIRLAVKASGWDALTEQYFWPVPFEGTQWTRQTIHFSFGLLLWRSVTIKLDSSGLYFEPQFPYAHIAPPIRIPWSDLTGTRQGIIRCTPLPSIRLRIAPKLLRRILECRSDYEIPTRP